MESRCDRADSTNDRPRRMLVLEKFRSRRWRVPIRRVTLSARDGFTLVEMLTVIAIVAVLATLLASGLSAAKRKAHQAACTSHLRQISLALNMYLDDHAKRPQALGDLVLSQYLPALPVLLCPADKSGNWGGLIQGDAVPGPGSSIPALVGKLESAPGEEMTGKSIPYSYFHPLAWEDALWTQLLKVDPNAGIAACQLHGIGRADLEAPSEHDFEGLVLRAQLDGAVVRRQVFRVSLPKAADFAGADAGFAEATAMPPGSTGFAPETSRVESGTSLGMAATAPVGAGEPGPWRFLSDKPMR